MRRFERRRFIKQGVSRPHSKCCVLTCSDRAIRRRTGIDLCFRAGCMDPSNPGSKALVGGGDVEAEMKRACENMMSVLEQVGSGSTVILKTNIYCSNMADYEKINNVYRAFFGDGDMPARVCVQVKGAAFRGTCRDLLFRCAQRCSRRRKQKPGCKTTKPKRLFSFYQGCTKAYCANLRSASGGIFLIPSISFTMFDKQIIEP